MIKSDETVIESGRRWMAGKVSDDEYYSRVHQSVIRTLAGAAAHRVASLLIRFLSRP